jgi:hypothetical protein
MGRWSGMAMDKNEKDKLYRYGKLVWDFANGKTTDDVLKSYFNNLQVVFNFSDDFTNNALTRFPTKQMINDALSIEEQKLFELLLHRNKILYFCNSYSFKKKKSFHITKFDPIVLMFTVSEESLVGDDPDFPDDVESTIRVMTEKEIEEYVDNFLIKDNDKIDFKSQLKTLVELCNQIERIKPMSKDRFGAIKAMAIDYP